jgi:hypothetical protein
LGIINEKDSLKMCCKMQSIKNHNSNCRQDWSKIDSSDIIKNQIIQNLHKLGDPF